MSQRHVDTLTALVIVAISPALVMFMVGSLIFFATHCFYDGSFGLRLRIASGLFVIAAVLVSRISIEEGREYASMFALPLSIVTILSMMRYTDVGLMSIPIVAFVWWSTDRLTWDSTVVDFKKDASGEGLLQTVGLDPSSQKDDAESVDSSANLIDTESTTDRAAADTRAKSPWQWWINRRRRHHTPGVWVIYFGMAAIPLFGLGQTLLPERMNGVGFLLLCIYVASALALLMTTSFLQMRRYLLQRRLPFTDKMAATWLGAGGMMIIALMILCLLLPRPNTGYSLIDSFEKVTSLDRKASKTSFGKEGVKDDEQSGRGESEKEQAATDSEDGRQTSDAAQQGSKSGDSPKTEGNQQSNSAQRSQGDSPDQQQDGQQNSQESRSNNQPNQQNGNRNNESRPNEDRQGERQQSNTDESNTDDNRDSGNSEKNSSENSESDGSDDAQSQNTSSSSSQPIKFPKPLQNISLPSIPRLIYYIAIALAVLVVLYLYGRQIFAAIAAFIRDIRNLLSRLFGGRSSAEDEIADAVPPPEESLRAFASFQDPFLAGTDDRYSTQQLVNYSFEALQAWARERNCGRSSEQTALEFAGQVGATHERVALPARNLAVLYSQAAYAPGTIGNESRDHLRNLWRALHGS